MKYLFSIAFCLLLVTYSYSQANERRERLRIDGEIVTALITENDTILIAELDDISVSTPRNFKDRAEYLRYLKYKRYAVKVYPYAVKAIRIFKESEQITKTMKKSKRKKHYRRLQKDLKKEFKAPLKKLTKTQGKILIKMIEKELDKPFYELIKNLRGGLSASYWQTMGKFFSYDLKEGYTPGKDAVLDAVLRDLNVSYEVEDL